MKPIFLDTRLPNFKEEEAKLLAKDYVEKKYTQHTAKEIEEAYIRHILPGYVTSNMSPAQITALKPKLEEIARSTLYEYSGSGVPILQFKMYIPGPKLIKQMKAAEAAAAAAQMGVEEEAEEEFAHEDYGKYASKVDKAENVVQDAYSSVIKISPNSTLNNIGRALNKSQSAYKISSELLPKLITFGNAQLISRGQTAFAKSQQLLAHSQAIKGKWGEPYNQLASRMGAMSVSKNTNSNFIEKLIKSTNNTNNFMGKAMAKGKTSADINFIRDILKIFMTRGITKEQAIYLGVILVNLPYEEFKMIMNQTDPKIGKENNAIAQQLSTYLMSKKTGGRKTKRRISKRRHTHRK
jgi:hypothetical protein